MVPRLPFQPMARQSMPHTRRLGLQAVSHDGSLRITLVHKDRGPMAAERLKIAPRRAGDGTHRS
jgi:hypothetical protein